MKKVIKKLFPNLFPSLHIIVGYIYDVKKFLKSSSDFHPNKSDNKLLSLLCKHTHGLEKAFSLPHTRPGFGIDLANQVILDCRRYYDIHGFDNHVKWALDVLEEYCEFQTANCHMDDELERRVASLREQISEYQVGRAAIGGYEIVSRGKWLNEVATCDFERFCKGRVSVRNFSESPISKELIEKAVSIALHTPSACNRQPWKVRVYTDFDKQQVLRNQNGNRGFSECIDTVLLISGLTSCFTYRERHEAWVDGGLFSMTLMLALHSLGVGVCPLNTAYTVKQELALRKETALPNDEEPIMMLAVGHLKREFQVAKSPRKQVDQVLHFE